eukprot:7644729-Alexandrium_andersonii.AAC.1
MGGEVVSTEAMFAALKRSIDDMPMLIGNQVFERTRVLIKAEVRELVEPAMVRLLALENAMAIMQSKSPDDRMPDGKRARSDDGGATSSTTASSRPSTPAS